MFGNAPGKFHNVCTFVLHSHKMHLEFIKLVEHMAIKGTKSFQNVKIRGILMLSLAKKIMTKYKMFLIKMALDNPTNIQVMLNYEHLCDLQIMFGLSCILSLLKFVHVFIKFAQSKDVFVHDLVVAIKVYQGDVSNINCD
jgi:hypothetical protein